MPAVDPVEAIHWTERLMDALLYQQTPLVVCLLVGATLGLLGSFVVLRRMALIGDALSHAVLPGVVIAFILVSAVTGILEGAAWVWGLFAGALLAGLLTTAGINLVVRHSRMKEDTAIGIVFTAMFAVGVVLISGMPEGTHFDLKCFLFGEVLAIGREDLVTSLIVTPGVLGLILLFYRPLKLVSFDAQMAQAAGVPVQFLHYLLMGLICGAVVAALRSVGVIMAVAMLITPAAIAYQLTNRFSVMLVLSAVAGAIAALLGFLLAFIFNTPPGPAMVIVATMLFGLTMAFAPEYGLIARALRRRRVRWHILVEDVLKSLTRLGPEAEPAAVRRIIGTNVSESELEAALRNLHQERLISYDANRATLTPEGRHRSELLVRSHRLWESYLAEHNLPQEMLHEVAERLEHAHELAEEVATELGHPQRDPHGEPIPARPEPAP